MPFTSGSIGAYIFGQLATPPTQIFEWDITEVSAPDGVRNLYAGHAAWVKELGITIPKAMEIEDVILDYADGSISGAYQSRLQVFTIGLATSDYSISNMRFWMPSGAALQSSGYMEFVASGTWWPNAHLPSGRGTQVPVALPAIQNILNQNDVVGNLDSSEDYDTSQYVYLSLNIPSGFGLGIYGLGTHGDLAFRITYDWYWKFSDYPLTA